MKPKKDKIEKAIKEVEDIVEYYKDVTWTRK